MTLQHRKVPSLSLPLRCLLLFRSPTSPSPRALLFCTRTLAVLSAPRASTSLSRGLRTQESRPLADKRIFIPPLSDRPPSGERLRPSRFTLRDRLLLDVGLHNVKHLCMVSRSRNTEHIPRGWKDAHFLRSRIGSHSQSQACTERAGCTAVLRGLVDSERVPK